MNVETVTIGALLRRSFRVACDMCGVEWTEHKGLLDSKFVVRGDGEQFDYLAQWSERVCSRGQASK